METVPEQSRGPLDVSDGELDRLTIARDRAAAALDRAEAKLSRVRAESFLRDSHTDTLTGALQRESGRERLESELARAQRTGSSLVVAFLDVVGLKQTNDTYGHAAGDLVLAAVGRALLAGLRSYDVVVRYGGDEFVCGLPHSSINDAARRIEQVRGTFERGESGIGVSVGLAELAGEDSLDVLVERADRAMYATRRETREPGLRMVAHSHGG